MKNILVPTDFSQEAEHALDMAYHIAKKTGAEIYLMHVVEDTTLSSFNVTGESTLPDVQDKIFVVKLIEKSRKQLSEDAHKYNDVTIHPKLRVGNPYHNIRDVIAEGNFDLVVMGTKGSSGLEEVLVGSNAEKVVRYSKCPVLTLRDKAGSYDFKNIVYASGLLETEDSAINIIKEFQNIFNSTIHLVRINTPNNFQRDSQSYAYMYDFIKKHNLENYTMQIFNDVSEEEGIIYFSDKVNADLIAMATHGRTGIAHLLAGSIAEDVVNHSNRPVLTHVVKEV